MSKERSIELQKQLRLAKQALEKIKHGHTGRYEASVIAEAALDEIWPLDRKQPLQGLVGHGPNVRA
jgi:hypothetical protein